MKQKKLIFLAAGLVLLLIAATVLYQQLGNKTNTDNLGTQDTEQPAQDKVFPPDFTVVDAHGQQVRLSDFRGKPTVVNFWATWCGYCTLEMPVFEEVYQQVGDEINFLMVNMTDGSRETIDTASTYIADNAYTFPVYYDTQRSAMIAYGAFSLPVTYFFDADGYGVAQGTGALDKDALLRGIAMITEP